MMDLLLADPASPALKIVLLVGGFVAVFLVAGLVLARLFVLLIEHLTLPTDEDLLP